MTHTFEQTDRSPRPRVQARGGGPVLPPVHQARRAARPAPQAGLDPDELERGGLGLTELIERFLSAEGVDVDQAIRDLGYARERGQRHVTARAEQIRMTARAERRARRALDLELDGYRRGAPGGYTAATVAARHGEVEELREALAELCGHDAAVIASARASAA